MNPEGANGAAIEHHKFAHLDCPLTPMRKSGHFVLAKFLNKERTEIAITGFQASGKKTFELFKKMKILFFFHSFNVSCFSVPRATQSTLQEESSTPTTTCEEPGGQCCLMDLLTRARLNSPADLSDW